MSATSKMVGDREEKKKLESSHSHDATKGIFFTLFSIDFFPFYFFKREKALELFTSFQVVVGVHFVTL